MKIRITVLKAPWPQGAKVGDVIETEEIPVWAAGKCVIVGDDEEATHQLAAAGEIVVKLSVDSAEIQDQFASLRDGFEQHLASVQLAHDGEKETLLEQIDERDLRIAELEAKLAAPAPVSDVERQAADEKAALEGRAALEAEAKSLGLDFHPNIGDAKLAAKIADKKGEAK